jgi:hypothetical protein
MEPHYHGLDQGLNLIERSHNFFVPGKRSPHLHCHVQDLLWGYHIGEAFCLGQLDTLKSSLKVRRPWHSRQCSLGD